MNECHLDIVCHLSVMVFGQAYTVFEVIVRVLIIIALMYGCFWIGVSSVKKSALEEIKQKKEKYFIDGIVYYIQAKAFNSSETPNKEVLEANTYISKAQQLVDKNIRPSVPR